MFRPVVAIIRCLSFDTLYTFVFSALKCVERQRPDDGHYWPKHVVFDQEYN